MKHIFEVLLTVLRSIILAANVFAVFLLFNVLLLNDFYHPILHAASSCVLIVTAPV